MIIIYFFHFVVVFLVHFQRRKVFNVFPKTSFYHFVMDKFLVFISLFFYNFPRFQLLLCRFCVDFIFSQMHKLWTNWKTIAIFIACTLRFAFHFVCLFVIGWFVCCFRWIKVELKARKVNLSPIEANWSASFTNFQCNFSAILMSTLKHSLDISILRKKFTLFIVLFGPKGSLVMAFNGWKIIAIVRNSMINLRKAKRAQTKLVLSSLVFNRKKIWGKRKISKNISCADYLLIYCPNNVQHKRFTVEHTRKLFLNEFIEFSPWSAWHTTQEPIAIVALCIECHYKNWPKSIIFRWNSLLRRNEKWQIRKMISRRCRDQSLKCPVNSFGFQMRATFQQ